MGRNQTKADIILNELRMIPKTINTLKEDAEALRESLLTSPQWSDMKTTGGTKRNNDDKYINIIDRTEYNQKEIARLINRREEIISYIMQIPDISERHVLLVTYARCNNYEEAMDKLDIRFRNKYFKLLRKGKESLEIILN